jgi:hypothetical protein
VQIPTAVFKRALAKADDAIRAMTAKLETSRSKDR